jgi:hypothetical protein
MDSDIVERVDIAAGDCKAADNVEQVVILVKEHRFVHQDSMPERRSKQDLPVVIQLCRVPREPSFRSRCMWVWNKQVVLVWVPLGLRAC